MFLREGAAVSACESFRDSVPPVPNAARAFVLMSNVQTGNLDKILLPESFGKQGTVK